MKTKTLIKHFRVLFLFFAQYATAQDFHLSQYDAAPQYLNPALTGMYFGDKHPYRVNANYRSQWKSLTGKAFSTATLGYDMPYKRFGVGGFVINNRAATGGFNTLNFLLSGAYNIMNDANHKHNLSVGFQMGIFQKSYNSSSLLFDNQYSSSAGGFDPAISSGENFSSNSLLRFDANLGIFYMMKDESKKVNPYGGFSIYHITQPDESFTSLKNKVPMRFNLHGGINISVNQQIMLSPTFLYMNQARSAELNIGALSYYKLKDSEYNLILGLSYRDKDAVIIHTGLKQGANIYRVSYDINTSYLNTFSKGRGGIEFSVIYTGKKK